MEVAVAMRSAKLLILAATVAAELDAQLGSEIRPPAAGIFVGRASSQSVDYQTLLSHVFTTERFGPHRKRA